MKCGGRLYSCASPPQWNRPGFAHGPSAHKPKPGPFLPVVDATLNTGNSLSFPDITGRLVGAADVLAAPAQVTAALVTMRSRSARAC
jgi:hypothetical protein